MTSLTLTWSRAPAVPRLGAATWLAAASFAAVTQALMVPGLLADIAVGLGAGLGATAQATTVFALGAAAGALPIARLCRRLPQQRVVVGGLAGLALVNGLVMLAPSLAALLALRLLAGLCTAAVLAAAPVLAVALALPSLRVRALAAVSFGSVLAFVLGLPAVTLVGGAFGWRIAFALAGIFSACAALAVGRACRGAPRALAGGSAQGHAHAYRAVATCLLLVLLAFAAVFATQTLLGPIAAVTLGASAAPLQALIGVGALLGVPAGTLLEERAPQQAARAIAASLLVAALWQWGLLAGGLHSPLLQAGQVVFASAALFAVSPVLQARLLAAASRAPTLMMAANFVAVSLGQALGAGLGGLALARAGLAGAAGVGVAAAGLMLVLAVRRAR